MRNGSYVLDMDPPQEMVAALCYRVEDKEFYEQLELQIKRDIPGVESALDWPPEGGCLPPIGSMTFQASDPLDRDPIVKVCDVLDNSGFRRIFV